jgi:hypothetical protein
MRTGSTAIVPVEPSDLFEEFARLVLADDELVRAEFDDLISDVWDDGQRSGRNMNARQSLIPLQEPPSWGEAESARALSTTNVEPLFDGWSRQRSPP